MEFKNYLPFPDYIMYGEKPNVSNNKDGKGKRANKNILPPLYLTAQETCVGYIFYIIDARFNPDID